MENVSLDIARILLTNTQISAKTDLSERALEMWDKSRVKHIEIVGRRGPLQVGVTTRELQELIGLRNVEIQIDRELLLEAAGRFAEPVMLKASKRPSLPTGSRTCTLRFLRIPLSLHGPSSASTHTSAPTEPIKSIEWQINELNYPLHRSPSGDYSSINSLSSQKSRLTTPQVDLPQ
ncbi:hypothetical protein KEM48_006639 [Puccinia striiformis f. sp. tritici PST-130]|nr:hypothetical protein KEM48_006639 [Puccinia striiformis f. sp. tritici PST-130]